MGILNLNFIGIGGLSMKPTKAFIFILAALQVSQFAYASNDSLSLQDAVLQACDQENDDDIDLNRINYNSEFRSGVDNKFVSTFSSLSPDSDLNRFDVDTFKNAFESVLGRAQGEEREQLCQRARSGRGWRFWRRNRETNSNEISQDFVNAVVAEYVENLPGGQEMSECERAYVAKAVSDESYRDFVQTYIISRHTGSSANQAWLDKFRTNSEFRNLNLEIMASSHPDLRDDAPEVEEASNNNGMGWFRPVSWIRGMFSWFGRQFNRVRGRNVATAQSNSNTNLSSEAERARDELDLDSELSLTANQGQIQGLLTGTEVEVDDTTVSYSSFNILENRLREGFDRDNESGEEAYLCTLENDEPQVRSVARAIEMIQESQINEANGAQAAYSDEVYAGTRRAEFNEGNVLVILDESRVGI